jgi:acetyl esterase/lipase
MKLIVLLCSFLITIDTFSQLPPEKPLYPDGIKNNPITHPFKESYVDSLVHSESLTGLNRVYSYVSEPTFMIFPADEKKNKNIGLVIFPGGGARNIWLDKEGTDIALRLSQQGITCMVVKYRINRRANNNIDGKFEIDYNVWKEEVLIDAQQSMRIMKSLSDSLKFKQENVGIMGFSAGGFVSQLLTYGIYSKETDEFLETDSETAPAFTALIYMGGSLDLHEKFKEHEKLPPFFMAVAGNDFRLNIKENIKYLARVAVTVPKSELHVYRDGGHGFGLGYDENSSVKDWTNAFINWIDSLY